MKRLVPATLALIVLSGLLVSVLAAEPAVSPARTEALASEPLFELLSVCPDPDDGSRWFVAWHPAADAVEPNDADRVFKNLQGRDFDACLDAIIKADPEANALLTTLRDERTSYRSIRRAVCNAWREAGVYEALEEVARLGRRGPKVIRVLNRCHAPRDASQRSPIREGGRP